MTILHWALIAAAAAVTAAAAFWTGIVTRTYRVESEKIRSGGYIRIVHLSDLHSTLFGKDQKKLIKAAELFMPDLILLTGDIVDDIRGEAPSMELFSGLMKMNTPIYYVSGNHEANRPDYDELMKKLESYRVKVLDGDSNHIEVNGVRLNICGIADPMKYQFPGYDKWEEALRRSFEDIGNQDEISVLLSHRPEKPELYAELGFDLVFCGHAHGGQVRIPKLLNGLYSPGQGLFPKYAGGVYETEGRYGRTVEIVSRGLSVFLNLPKIFIPPEVVCVVLSGNDDQTVFR